MRFATAVVAAMLLLTGALQGEDAQAVLARARKQIESADYRASGKLVTVDAKGKRTSYALTILAHWFPGVLRALVEIVPPAANSANLAGAVRMLLEMRPGGQDTIRIARLGGAGIEALPFEKWDEGLFGGAFSYADFLEPQYYWQNQVLLKSAQFGTHLCDVLKSSPGSSDRTHYASVQTWLDHSIGYPVYAEKTLKGGDMVKEFTYIGLRQTAGVWSATQVEAKVRGRQGSTLLIVQRGSAKAHLSARDFSPEQITHFEDHP
ncbi:MAG TPA: outer membrane lipoprotein-sorting protein [Terracidiphilus sp.]|nr:outer membrane lipoprotein-sorting protein [Terracidiphilus sp.]